MPLNENGDPRAPIVRNGPWILLSSMETVDGIAHTLVKRFNLKSHQWMTVYRSRDGSKEDIVAALDPEGRRFLIRHETETQAPGFAIVDGKYGSRLEIIGLTSPVPEASRYRKELLEYKRSDGLRLASELYLPKNIGSGTKLPLIIWGYPRDHSAASDIGKGQQSSHQFEWEFPSLNSLPLLFLLNGYAVAYADMPVIGGKAANDTYVEQLVSDSEAIVQAIGRTGLVDADKVGVIGHSYGGKMVATLLEHTHLFASGVAMSGSYNETDDPFGFQTESRTLWEAPQTYFAMSPLLFADRMNAPILLIHGMVDENGATLPEQSERFFQALSEQHKIARLLMLPYERHVFEGRESMQRIVCDSFAWFDRYVKHEAPDK
jgi:dipeptidyl aminopeptidase/acylaminoacyl peptidase